MTTVKTPLVQPEGPVAWFTQEIDTGNPGGQTYDADICICYPSRHFWRTYRVNGATAASEATYHAERQALKEYPDASRLIPGPAITPERARELDTRLFGSSHK